MKDLFKSKEMFAFALQCILRTLKLISSLKLSPFLILILEVMTRQRQEEPADQKPTVIFTMCSEVVRQQFLELQSYRFVSVKLTSHTLLSTHVHLRRALPYRSCTDARSLAPADRQGCRQPSLNLSREEPLRW